MKLKTVFLFSAVMALLFGVGLILTPSNVAEMYGLDVTPATTHTAQLLGAAFLSIGLISYTARNMDVQSAKPITMSLFYGNTIGLIVEIKDKLGGVTNEMGWLSVAIYLILVIGFGYFAFIKKE